MEHWDTDLSPNFATTHFLLVRQTAVALLTRIARIDKSRLRVLEVVSFRNGLSNPKIGFRIARVARIQNWLSKLSKSIISINDIRKSIVAIRVLLLRQFFAKGEGAYYCYCYCSYHYHYHHHHRYYYHYYFCIMLCREAMVEGFGVENDSKKLLGINLSAGSFQNCPTKSFLN